MIETMEIRMPSKKMLSILFMLYGMPWIGSAFFGFIVFIIIGFIIDYRFLVLSLIWIFLLVPLVVAFLYFFYGMDPLTTFNCMPHKIIFDDEELTVRLLDKEHKEGVAEQCYKDYKIKNQEYKKVKRGSDFILLLFHDKGWLWVPSCAFDSPENFKSALSLYER